MDIDQIANRWRRLASDCRSIHGPRHGRPVGKPWFSGFIALMLAPTALNSAAAVIWPEREGSQCWRLRPRRGRRRLGRLFRCDPGRRTGSPGGTYRAMPAIVFIASVGLPEAAARDAGQSGPRPHVRSRLGAARARGPRPLRAHQARGRCRQRSVGSSSHIFSLRMAPTASKLQRSRSAEASLSAPSWIRSFRISPLSRARSSRRWRSTGRLQRVSPGRVLGARFATFSIL